MVPAQCPVCHQKPAMAGNTVYCPHCGWNRDSAISGVRMSLNAVPIAVLMFGGMTAFMYFRMGFRRAPQLLIFTLIPFLGVLFNYVWSKRTLAKLQTVQKSPQAAAVEPMGSNFAFASDVGAPTAEAPSVFDGTPVSPASGNTSFGGAFTSSSAPGSTAFQPSAKDGALVRSVPPRRIRVSKSGRLVFWVTAFGLSLFVLPFAIGAYKQWTLYHSFAHVTGIGWGIGLEVIVVLAAYGIWRGQVQECDLLEHGEAVMGRVLSQWRDNKNNSTVQFEFTDFMGSSHRGSAMDRTSQLFSGMPLVIFYDRNNPKRQIAYCSTLHEVVLP